MSAPNKPVTQKVFSEVSVRDEEISQASEQVGDFPPEPAFKTVLPDAPKEERKTSKAASYGMIPRSESRKLAESNNTKIQLTWKNVTISSVPRGRCGRPIPGANEKVIIDDVSGTVAPGQFLAIIGASGERGAA